jgi:hypothetical protein
MTAPTVVLDQDVDTRNKLSVPWLTNVLFGHGQYVPISDNGDDRRERDQWDAKGFASERVSEAGRWGPCAWERRRWSAAALAA